MPMWLKSIVPLKIKGAVKQDRQIELSGVGGKTSGELYKVNFDFGNIHFKDLPIVHKEIKVADAYMILPATLFEDMAYEIDNINHTFKVKFDSKGYYRQFTLLHYPAPSISCSQAGYRWSHSHTQWFEY